VLRNLPKARSSRANLAEFAQVVGKARFAFAHPELPAVDYWRAAEHHGRRADVALPDATIIEL
jgi:hypothetical protein